MVRFDDTEIAFRDKSLMELKRAYWLFRLIGNPVLVKLGSIMLRFSLKIGLPVRWLLKPTIFAHFCGGESISDCEGTVRKLARSNVLSILDYSSEGKDTDSDFEYTLGQIMQTIDKAAVDPFVPYAVFKPTGLARFALLERIQSGGPMGPVESAEYEKFAQRLRKICLYARQKGVPVMVDAEESWIQSGVDKLVEVLMFEFNTDGPLVFNTLQMYRHDRLEYIRSFREKAKQRGVFSAFKLVRGAYMEKERARAAKMGYPSPIYPDKQATDDAFDAATRFCLENIHDMAVCIGTHNELSCAKAFDTMQEHGIRPDHPHVSFAQLLGMSDHISYRLASESCLVCKYVPYGPVKTVMPYMIRRAEENTSVAGQTPRELAMIRAEMQRRRSGDA